MKSFRNFYPLLVVATLTGPITASAFSPNAVTKEFTVLSTIQQKTKHPSSKRLLLTRPFSTSVDEQETTPQKLIQTKSNVEDTKSTTKFTFFQLPKSGKEVLPSKDAILTSVPTAASVFIATFGTFILNNYLSLGPVKSSSIAGLIATMILPEKLAIAAFCGSFAGMARMAVIPSLGASALLGMVCAAMLTLFDKQKWLLGVGGRLGFIAQCACTTQFLVSSLLVGAPEAPAALIGNPILPNPTNLMRQIPFISAYTVVGALFMRFWKFLLANKSERLANSVGAVGATGLLAGVVLPASVAGPIFCGSFVAMAAPTKLPTRKSLIGASILAALSQQSLAGIMLGGWGGKLGTAALMGVVSYSILNNLFEKFTQLPRPEVAMAKAANAKA